MITLSILLRGSGNPTFGLLTLFIVLIFVAAGSCFTRKATVLRNLKKAGLKKVKDFSDGDKGKIIGKVVFAGETIVAPLTFRTCVYYNVIVEQYRSNGKHSSWHKIIEEEERGDIVIDDGSGFAIIDTNNAISYLVPDANYTSSSSEDPTPQLESFLAKHNISSEGFFGFNKTLRYKEGILERDELFTVAGQGQWNETIDHKLNLSAKKVLVIVPTEQEKVYLTDDQEAIDENEQQ